MTSPDNPGVKAQSAASPLISIIVAVFNGAATLQRCIDSVVRQTCSNHELIVIDGGSTDGTAELLRANSMYFSYWISEPDNGIYNAWNKGVAQAKGDWICFLGADDWLYDETALGRASDALKQFEPASDIVYGQVRMLNAQGDEVARLGEPWGAVKQRFMNGTYCLPTPGVFHHRRIFAERGYFDESYRIAGDYELLLRTLKSTSPMFLAGLIVTNMQQGGISSRPDSALISLREMANARRKNQLANMNLGLALGFIRVYVRTLAWRVLGERLTRRLLDAARRMSGKTSYWTKI